MRSNVALRSTKKRNIRCIHEAGVTTTGGMPTRDIFDDIPPIPNNQLLYISANIRYSSDGIVEPSLSTHSNVCDCRPPQSSQGSHPPAGGSCLLKQKNCIRSNIFCAPDTRISWHRRGIAVRTPRLTFREQNVARWGPHRLDHAGRRHWALELRHVR